ncbi:MAG: SsrA-binding protein [Actinomycetota bacterium]|jgi:SsrA-binding protein|nr:SsrA-binding protein [Actinomycetota bacterium]
MPKAERTGVVATNRKARHNYDILETFEAGIVLHGSEVKSLREAQVQMGEAYAVVDDGDVWIHNVHIAEYSNVDKATRPTTDRKRKLLLHRKEIDEIGRKVNIERLTLIPLSIYFKDGRAKIEIAIARGRKQADKRRAIAEKDMARDLDRSLSQKRR